MPPQLIDDRLPDTGRIEVERRSPPGSLGDTGCNLRQSFGDDTELRSWSPDGCRDLETGRREPVAAELVRVALPGGRGES